MAKTTTKKSKSIQWNYSPAPESSSIAKIDERYELFIGGKFVKPLSGKYFDTINPATEKKLSEIANANAADVDLAVKSARNAYDKYWKNMAGADRAKYLFRIARLIQEKAREFAVIESMDGGKPIKESRDIDIPLAANHFFYNAGWADKLEYAFPNRSAMPLGVAAGGDRASGEHADCATKTTRGRQHGDRATNRTPGKPAGRHGTCA